MTVETTVSAAANKWGVWLTAHHVVLYIALAAALGFGIYTVESKYAAVKTAEANAAVQALAAEKQHEADLVAQFDKAQAARDAQDAALLKTIQTVQSQTKVQIVHDKALPAPDLGHRIETITGFKQGTITLDASQDLIVPLPLGQEIVARLDQGIADAATVVAQAGIIKNDEAEISDQAVIIENDKKILADQITADGKVLSAEKAKCRKSKWKWFLVGLVSGFVGRSAIK
jgi:hypothetical protein